MNQNIRVRLVEQTFGIELPEFKIHVSCRGAGDPKDDSVPDSAKWKHVAGALILPQELEIHLPKEGMNPEQAIAHLNICSSISRGGGNDAYQLYTQEVMMKFLYVAISNCIYLASFDYDKWNKPVEVDQEETFLDLVKKEITWILREAFSKQRPILFGYQRQAGHLFLRLLLENNAPLHQGRNSDHERCSVKGVDIRFNTIFELLMQGGDDAYSRVMGVYEDFLYNEMARLIGLKCYELTEQLQESKD